MASPTPGALSKLLANAAGNVTSPSSSHRSPLLQVIEIVPCLADDPWRSEGFFVKVSDSLHAAYVAVRAGDDADLIRSDEIQLGQLVYVRGGLRVEKGCPVPVIRGLKPVPKRRPCFGNPSDLVSSDVLIPFTQTSLMGDMEKKMRMKKDVLETRRLSLDSARKGWDQTPRPPLRRDAALLTSPRLRNKLVFTDKKAPPKIESPSRHLSSDTSALENRNVVMPPPKSMDKASKDGIKSSPKAVVPVALSKMPFSPKSWFDRRILWSGLPSTIQMLGKEVSSHKNVAVSAAVSTLEEASAMECLLNCLRAFGELCESSQKLSAGRLVQQFLDLYHITQSSATTVRSLLNSRSPGSMSTNHSGSHDHNSIAMGTSTAKKNAASWVQAAVVSDLARFSLFKEPGTQEAAVGQEHHFIMIENSSEERSPENPTKGSKKDLRNPAKKGVASPLTKQCSAANRKHVDSKSRLKESASLGEELLLVSRQWFLKYLEDSLNKGFFSIKREVANGNASLLLQLKKVIYWLDGLIVNKMETSRKIEDLREKLQRFLLEHIEASIAQTRPRS